MATTEQISKVRRRIGDSAKQGLERIVGDDTTAQFKLAFQNVFDLSVKQNGEDLAPTAYTLNAKAGVIIFNEAPQCNDTTIVQYSYAAYSDEDIATLIDNYTPEGAVVEALQELLVDAARLYDYQQGQTIDKRSQIFDHLEKLLVAARGDFTATQSNGLKIGQRHPQENRVYNIGIDLSRDDTFSPQREGYSNNNV